MTIRKNNPNSEFWRAADEASKRVDEFPDWKLGKLKTALSFDVLREANLARLPLFKNAKGEPAHSQPDGSDWSDSDWLMAVTGELGEFANLRKKVLRGDIDIVDAKPELAKELADVVIYLDILAFRMGIDLGDAVRDKWNEVSRRVGVDMRITKDNELKKLHVKGDE